MPVDSKHPLFMEHEDEWAQMRDTFKGDRIVKKAGSKYLPFTTGMILDGAPATDSKGWKSYTAYRMRARFTEVVREGVDAMLGVMHNKPPTIELPEQMEYLRTRSSLRNESLEMVLRRINEEQLVVGRVGILADVIDSGENDGDLYISVYEGDKIINWDEAQRSRSLDTEDGGADQRIEMVEPENLNFVSLDESGPERIDNFEWRTVRKYRVLVLGDVFENEPLGEGFYKVGVFRDTPGESAFNEADLVEVNISGKKFKEIPFVFINTKDISPEPDEPPLLGLSNLSLTIYRGEADYRQSLFMQGQDTLVVIGGVDGAEYRTGAEASITISNPLGSADFIGVDSSGISEQRLALENDHIRAALKAGQMLSGTSEAESGEALKIRVSARTSTLNQVALTGAFGLENLLKKMARWLGADPEKVIVTPNLDFVDDRMASMELVQMIAAKLQGFPLSLESMHKVAKDRGFTDMEWDTEVSTISKEQDLALLGIGSSNEDGPEEDEPSDDTGEGAETREPAEVSA